MTIQEMLESGGKICHVYEENGEFKVETGNDKSHFSDLSAEEQNLALTWLEWNIYGAHNVLRGHTSYGMKHVLESRTNIYMTNNQFKEAMLKLWHFPHDVNTLNWEFSIKKGSPIFKLQIDKKYGLPLLGTVVKYFKENA